MKQEYTKLVGKMLRQKDGGVRGNLLPVVKDTLSKRRRILQLAEKLQTPFYLFDQLALSQSIKEFKTSFQKSIQGFTAYYAVKSNPYPGILRTVVKSGFGLDVSSGRELKLAIGAGAKQIVFSGPGKSIEELKLAIKNRSRVIVQMDSVNEMKKLGALLKTGEKIRAGIRVHANLHGSWDKFGIDLGDLSAFWRQAKKYPGIQLQGIQAHMSLNDTSQPYADLIKILAGYLKKNFTAKELNEIKFIDLGGGFCPRQVDGIYPWDTPQGSALKIAGDYLDKKINFPAKYYLGDYPALSEYSRTIGFAINKNLKPLVNCRYFFEPGRIISTKAMHLVMKVADVKTADSVILDGGINMVGWEYYLTNYYPVINLTHPAFKEIKVKLYGNLCLPEDIWGYYCYAQKMQENDVIIIPNQGAYTFTWAQNFIKPIPPVYKI